MDTLLGMGYDGVMNEGTKVQIFADGNTLTHGRLVPDTKIKLDYPVEKGSDFDCGIVESLNREGERAGVCLLFNR